ncbi:hypothetical protein T484DRAFT_1776906, partial [Baffinella frigidus]
MREIMIAAASVPRLQALWAQLKILSDPLQVCAAAIPPGVRELLGGDLTSDDVTRRTLMWAMSNHDAVDVDALALMMHDVAALQEEIGEQCSCMSLLVYNMWLSALFILHNNKHGTPE